MKIGKMEIAILLAVLSVCSCSRATDRCTLFSTEYKRMDVETTKFAEVSLELPEIKKAISIIYKCYPNHKYMGFGNELKIKRALKFRDDVYLIIAELHGVSDLIIMFEINKSGGVIGTYQGSTL